MQNFRSLVRAVETTSQLVELARSSQQYRFAVPANTTVYLHVAQAEIFAARHDHPSVEVLAKVGAPFAWRIACEQDDAGVYFVAQRKPLVGQLAGALASAAFIITIPLDAHLILKLEDTRLSMQALTGEFEFAPLPTSPLLRASNSSSRVG